MLEYQRKSEFISLDTSEQFDPHRYLPLLFPEFYCEIMPIILNVPLRLSLDLLDALIAVCLIALGLILFFFAQIYIKGGSLIGLWHGLRLICSVSYG